MSGERIDPITTSTQNTQNSTVTRHSEERINSVITESKKSGEKPVATDTTETPVIEYDTIYVDKVVNDTIYISKEEQLAAQRREQIKKVANNIVSQLYKSIDGLGTDDELFEKTLNRINKDNILEVMEEWDRTCGKEYGETFFESFLGDADSTQRKEYGAKLMNALVARANEIGRDDNGIEIRLQDFNKELNSNFFVNNSKLAAIFNVIADETKLFQQHAEAEKAKQNVYTPLDKPIIFDTGKVELQRQTGVDENGNPVYEVIHLQKVEYNEIPDEPVYTINGEIYREVKE